MDQASLNQDDSFKKFLESLNKKATADLALQTLQVKYDREVAGEDDDKREEQLDKINDTLVRVEQAVLGFSKSLNVAPLQIELSNQTEILKKSLEELSVNRKINEGSLEYDKQMAVYRNTSGRDVVSDVSGKVSKTGQVVDFETARDFTKGSAGKRAQEAAQLKLQPVGKYKLAQATQSSIRSFDKEKNDSNEITRFGNLEDLGKAIGSRITGIFKFMASKFDKKPGDMTVNEAQDNRVSSVEALAKTSEEDSQTSKESLNIQTQQLNELKQIKIALSPKVPSELPESEKLKPGPIEQQSVGSQISGGSLLGDALGNRAGKSTGAKSKPSIGGRILGAARVLGPIGAAAGAAYGGFQGYSRAGEVFGVDQDKATTGQKISSAIGGITDPFGLGYGDTVAKGVHSVGEKIGGFFGGIKDKVVGVMKPSGESTTTGGQPPAGLPAQERTLFGSTTLGKLLPSTTNNVSASQTSTDDYNVTPEQMLTPVSKGASNLGAVIDATSKENAAIKDQMSNVTKTTTPIVSSSVNTVNTTSYTPIKSSPRSSTQGSALERYQNRLSAY